MNDTSRKTRPVEDFEWEGFLSRHDLVWGVLPRRYGEAPFFGNGLLGSVFYADEASGSFILEVFRSDIHDHRDSTHGWTAYSRPRFVVGYFEIQFPGRVIDGSLRLHLYDAELRGTVQTDGGEIGIRHYIHSVEELMLFECWGNGAERVNWVWHPGEAKTTREGIPYTQDDVNEFADRYGDHYRRTLRLYEPNPPVRQETRDEVHLSVQDLLAGGQYVTAWKTVETSTGGSVACITISNSYPDLHAEQAAIESLNKAAGSTLKALESSHVQWWHEYYRQSFLSLPDTRIESFYWIQMYKLACATRADRPVMDTSGPWFQATPWPYITTDLNLQLCYWPVCASNRLELGHSLLNALVQNTETLIENVRPVEWQADSAYMNITCAHDFVGPRDDDMRYYDCVGNLTWTMHNAWMIYRYSMDSGILGTIVLPLLERCVGMYVHLCEADAAGTLHLKPTYSPEYPENPTRDCNYDLSLFKWGCRTLIEGYRELGRDHPKIPQWKRILDSLADYPVDENGIRIGADVGFTKGHRHFSHLLMLYPLYELNIAEPGVRDVVRTSVAHWIDRGALAGYSFTGASSLSSAIGDGNAALEYLTGLDPYVEPNTLYTEAGPCMETPLAAAQSIHDMLLQSWGGIIRIFPAVPDIWHDVVFHKMRGEGAFLLSACRMGGRTTWIHVESLAGAACRIHVNIEAPEFFIDGKRVRIEVEKNGVAVLNLKKGSTALVKRTGINESISVQPLAADPARCNSYGLPGGNR